jgi:hypothetical protein
VPRDFISADGFGITAAARRYLAPLIVGEAYPSFKNGLPEVGGSLDKDPSGQTVIARTWSAGDGCGILISAIRKVSSFGRKYSGAPFCKPRG